MGIENAIQDLLETKKALLLAHYYQPKAIQDIAHFVGDSLELAQKATTTTTEIIVFAGVYFMAETAKILNPNKKILIPDATAGCSLADGCNLVDFQKFKRKYPKHRVVSYVNTHAAIKAESDYVCTSSNAEKIIHAIPKSEQILFAPDKNLGQYLIEKTGRNMVLWQGSCVVHEAFSVEKIIAVVRKHPEAEIVAHPESESNVLKLAHFIGSTSKMGQYIKTSSSKTFIVATEVGILHQLQQEIPQKNMIPAPINEDNQCACSECFYMKLNSLEKIYQCLINEAPEIILDAELSKKARKPLKKMLAMS
ncbi:MAG: quinolinate synthase NadA [Flavobacteriaceae bacterium]|nr:quinolinate synthase NadA [Flavobacteriaceae bacterium]